MVADEVGRLRRARHPGGVVLHCQLYEALYWLMPRLSRFQESHPDIELRVASSLLPTNAAEPFDVVVQTTRRPSGSALLASTASDTIYPVASPERVTGAGLLLELRDLVNCWLLSDRVAPQDWLDWPDWFVAFDEIVPTISRIVTFDSFPLVLQAANSGQGQR